MMVCVLLFVLCLLLFLSSTTLALSSSSSNNNQSTQQRIQVCQNKNCCKRFRGASSLPEILQDLLPLDVDIESTGCLSNCDQGPNMIIIQKGGEEETLVQGVVDPATAVAQIEANNNVVLPVKLVAAVTVMEKGQKAKSFEEQEKCFSSVIRVLNNNNEGDAATTAGLSHSSANIHAHLLRAEARNDASHFGDALTDAQTALEIIQKSWTTSSDGSSSSNSNNILQERQARAHRLLAQAYEGIGNIPQAMEEWRRLAACSPSFQTKAAREIQRLKEEKSI